MASASSYWISLKASPIQLLPVAQAVTTHLLGPRMPNSMEISPTAMLGKNPGMKKGETLSGPWSRRVRRLAPNMFIPPAAVPSTTPTLRELFWFMGSLASCIAKRAATSAYCMKGSVRLIFFLSRKSSGWKSLSSAAICTLKPEGSNLVILATPDLPWHSFRQDSSAPVAKGVTAPSPVITTLLVGALFTLVGYLSSRLERVLPSLPVLSASLQPKDN